jgi:diguanylate cyclase (GGDEF)-like protein
MASREIDRDWLRDRVSGLANRSSFLMQLAELGQGGKTGSLHVVHLIDLDRFGEINEAYGRPAGDDLLREVAWRLKRSIRDMDFFAHFGGDEFAVLQMDVPSLDIAQATADRFCELVGRSFWQGGHELKVGASIGLAAGRPSETDGLSLLAGADCALDCAKAEGRNCVRVFEDADAAAELAAA